MASNKTIVCVGELLWDVLPDGRTLGGAPANVAYHLARLGRAATLVTRVGRDEPGGAARVELAAHGIDVACVQTDAELATGAAYVTLAAHGQPAYRFVTPAAFDAIEAPPLAPDVVVFGTLAQRDARSARTIRRMAAGARVGVYDVNLRPPFTSIDTVAASLPLATIVKLNDEELVTLAAALGFPVERREFAERMAARYGVRVVCITRGADGAGLLADSHWYDVAGIAINTIDTVGAGDAFLAALVAGWLEARAPQTLLERANRLGAYVAARRGGMPAYDARELGFD
ncbi:MAG: carbohydrate kinase [Gammaproteobacteria bacterium]